MPKGVEPQRKCQPCRRARLGKPNFFRFTTIIDDALFFKLDQGKADGLTDY